MTVNPVTVTAPRLLVIQHEDDAPLAWFGEWFSDAGVEVDTLRAHRHEVIPSELSPYDGLVVLGGAMGAYDDEAYAWLEPTKQLIRAAVRGDSPFLGICLGHQLATIALGGEVLRNPHGRADGLVQITRTDAGLRDDLLSSLPASARSVQWNDDVVARLPAGGVTLATAPDGTVQAARFGPMSWGLQFHPEASPAVFETWIAAEEPLDEGGRARLRTVLREIEAAEDDLRRDLQPLARRFAGIVTSRLRVP